MKQILEIGRYCTTFLFFLIDTTVAAQNYYGEWKGNATQPNAETTTWNVVMRLGKESQTIAFPSLGCGGTINYVRKEGNSFIFSETLTYGRDKCMLGLSIRFMLLNNTTMNWEEIDSKGTIIAYGTLTRESLPDVNIVVKRVNKYPYCTQGELFVNGKFFCKTLELRFDNAKKDSSSIPVGTYKAEIRFSTKKNRWVIELENIYPHVYYKEGDNWKMKTVIRDFVQIHSGDYQIKSGVNLQGCVLVGMKYKDCGFVDSKDTFKELLDTYFGSATDPDESVRITVTVQIDY